MQKLLSILVVVILGFVSQTQADTVVTYTGGLTGVDCAGCKRNIASTFAKIKGVKTIRIAKKSSNSHVLTVITDGSKAISKSQAVKALGKCDSHKYKMTSWSSTTSHSH